MADYAALIGIDWADSKHHTCLVDPQTGRREASVLRHSPEAIDERATALRARYGRQSNSPSAWSSRGGL